MSKEVEASIPFAALSRTTKRIYQVICTEIARSGTGSAPITAAALMTAINSNSTAAIAAASRELRGLKFITTETGNRGVSVFALSDGWQSISDPVAAKRMAAEARATKKRGPLARSHVRSRKPVEVEPEAVEVEREPEQPPRAKVTLAMLPWPTPAGLRLLAESP
jgi:hypothetical protein